MPANALLTTTQAARELGCSPDRVADMCRRGELRSSRDGFWYRIARADLDAYRHRGEARYCTAEEVQAMIQAAIAEHDAQLRRELRLRREAADEAKAFAAKWGRKR